VRALSVAGFLAMVGGVVGLWKFGALFSRSPAAIAAQAAAVVLFVWARATFGFRSFHAAADPTEGGLVTTGPYRWLRHPLYAAIAVFAGAGAAARLSRGSFFFVLLLAGIAARIFAEEKLVTARYPEYREYAARTRRLIPFVF
jgi:protein-S-isoprenylcysteine O-methyltransferase Ste14